MKEILVYLLITAICTGVLYGCFRVFMRKEACFVFNRASLLLIVVLPLFIPLLPSPGEWTWRPDVIDAMMQSDAPYGDVSAVARTVFVTETGEAPVVRQAVVSPVRVLFWTYLTGVVVSFAWFVAGIFRFYRWLGSARPRIENGVAVVVLPGAVPAVSFGKYVVISADDYADNRDEILLHEQAHRRLGHLFDLLLLAVAQVFFWFNPVLWLLKRDMRDVHEYQADDYAVKAGVDVLKYQLLIIRKSAGAQQFSFATGFNNSRCQTKKRIAMMNRPQENGWNFWKILGYFPVLVLLLNGFGKVSAAGSYAARDAVSETVPESPALPNAGKAPDKLYGRWRFQGDVSEFGCDTNGQSGRIFPLTDRFSGENVCLEQKFPGAAFAGKRVRATALVKVECKGAQAGSPARANFVMSESYNLRVEGNHSHILSRMVGTEISISDRGWTLMTMVMDMHSTTEGVSAGVFCVGAVEASVKDVKLEIVGEDVPLTSEAHGEE